ncbi:MAG: MoxR family ATPase [bacterium]|nr:MoxR family ATPase [bacterium]
MEFREEFKDIFTRLKEEISKVIVGYDEIIEQVLIALFSGGHILLEGLPGLGKTLMVKTLAEALDLTFSRIQFTPDLMPSDIIGTNVMEQDRTFRFQPGPIFAQIILADEINRATPKTQSALLEAMQEHSVTVSGIIHRLKEPFFVMATQNPIEMEGTYPLPEAQLDRFFFKLKLGFPNKEELIDIIDRTTNPEIPKAEKILDGETIEIKKKEIRSVPVSSPVKDYAVRLVLATHPELESSPPMVRRYVRYGASPRGVQSLILGAKVKALIDGRYNVSFSDIRYVAKPSLRHRVILNFEGEAEGLDTDTIIDHILEEVPELENEPVKP